MIDPTLSAFSYTFHFERRCGRRWESFELSGEVQEQVGRLLGALKEPLSVDRQDVTVMQKGAFLSDEGAPLLLPPSLAELPLLLRNLSGEREVRIVIHPHFFGSALEQVVTEEVEGFRKEVREFNVSRHFLEQFLRALTLIKEREFAQGSALLAELYGGDEGYVRTIKELPITEERLRRHLLGFKRIGELACRWHAALWQQAERRLLQTHALLLWGGSLPLGDQLEAERALIEAVERFYGQQSRVSRLKEGFTGREIQLLLDFLPPLREAALHLKEQLTLLHEELGRAIALQDRTQYEELLARHRALMEAHLPSYAKLLKQGERAHALLVRKGSQELFYLRFGRHLDLYRAFIQESAIDEAPGEFARPQPLSTAFASACALHPADPPWKREWSLRWLAELKRWGLSEQRLEELCCLLHRHTHLYQPLEKEYERLMDQGGEPALPFSQLEEIEKELLEESALESLEGALRSYANYLVLEAEKCKRRVLLEAQEEAERLRALVEQASLRSILNQRAGLLSKLKFLIS